jgi:hypothetical protein
LISNSSLDGDERHRLSVMGHPCRVSLKLLHVRVRWRFCAFGETAWGRKNRISYERGQRPKSSFLVCMSTGHSFLKAPCSGAVKFCRGACSQPRRRPAVVVQLVASHHAAVPIPSWTGRVVTASPVLFLSTQQTLLRSHCVPVPSGVTESKDTSLSRCSPRIQMGGLLAHHASFRSSSSSRPCRVAQATNFMVQEMLISQRIL